MWQWHNRRHFLFLHVLKKSTMILHKGLLYQSFQLCNWPTAIARRWNYSWKGLICMQYKLKKKKKLMLKPLLPLTELKITTVTTTLYSQIVLDIRSFLAQRGPSVFAMYSWMSVHLHFFFFFKLHTWLWLLLNRFHISPTNTLLTMNHQWGDNKKLGNFACKYRWNRATEQPTLWVSADFNQTASLL